MKEVEDRLDYSSFFIPDYQAKQCDFGEFVWGETLTSFTRNFKLSNIEDTPMSTWDERLPNEYDITSNFELGKTVAFNARISSIEKNKPIIVL